MADVLALVPDLLFGSRLQGSLQAAGHQVQLTGDAELLRQRLRSPSTPAPDVLVIDLTDERLDGAGLLVQLRGSLLGDGTRTLAFYSHVEAHTRARAERAGFDLVVARSRVAREAGRLVAGLAAGS